MRTYPINIGCTAARHAQIGIDAIVNARGGLGGQLNNLTIEEENLRRDARAMQARIHGRVRWYGPNSKYLRRRKSRFAHLISERGE